MSLFDTSYFYCALALVIGIPLSIVCLNELIDRSQRAHGSYTHVLSFVRDVVLPLFVLTIMLRYVFVVDDQNLPTKLVSTAFWLVLIVAVFRLSRKFIGSGDYPDNDWRSLIPHMFLRLPPYAIIGFVVYHVIENLWSFPVREMATTLGIGSIVIAFALQDTLSSLVSGLLLVANSPFKTGDWVKVGDVEGQIGEVNWRYTNIRTPLGDLVVIPNGSISGESIKNFSRPSRSTSVRENIFVAYGHSPNVVRNVFMEVINDTEGILQSPKPRVDLVTLDDPAMEYRVEYWVEDYSHKKPVHAELMSRLWYAVHRNNIALPTPVQEVMNFNASNASAEQERHLLELKSCVKWLPNFAKLPIAIQNHLADVSAYQLFSKGETVIKKHSPESGLFVIVDGVVSVTDNSNHNIVLRFGQFFGETGLFGRAVSPETVVALEDTEILCIPHNAINDIINHNPEFARSISNIIDERNARKQQRQSTKDRAQVGRSPASLKQVPPKEVMEEQV